MNFTKRHGNLYSKVIEENNIKNAIINASRNKKSRKQVNSILTNSNHYIKELQVILANKIYEPSPYIKRIIKDNSSGKERVLFKPRFYPDQCIHWALMQIIEPVLKSGMYEYNCGSVPGRGTHYAKKRVERWVGNDEKNTKYVLQIDISKFYPSVDKEILKRKLRTKFKDKDVLWLLDSIIDSNEEGLPIGNYTSPWLANFYLQELDHLIKEQLKVKYYVRYADDCILFGNNKKKLHKAKKVIESELASIQLKIKDNWQVYRLDKRPLDFLGFRFYRTHTTMRRRNSLRIRRRARKIYKKGQLNYKDSAAMLSYLGFVKHTNSHAYFKKNIEPYINIEEMKEVIRNESRKQYNAQRGI